MVIGLSAKAITSYVKSGAAVWTLQILLNDFVTNDLVSHDREEDERMKAIVDICRDRMLSFAA